MAKIDILLQQMMQGGATCALLSSGAPATLETSAGTRQGKPLSGAQIEAMLIEIMPIEAQQSLQSNGFVAFTYELPNSTAPQGAFNFEARQIEGDQWQVEIRPADVPFPTTMPATVVEANVASSVQIAKPKAPPPFAPSGLNATTPPAPPPSPPANYPPSVPNPNANNDSGMGDASVLPAELQGFNWGALLGSWIWGIGNNVWLGLLGLIPCLGFFVRFYLGSKGNEMAWKSKRWESVQAFQSAQKTWTIVGVALAAISVLFVIPAIVIPAAVTFPVFARANENARRSSCQSNLKQIGLAVLQFSQDHNETYPVGTTMAEWKPQLMPYLKSEALFVCPSHTGAGESYKVNPALSGLSMAAIENISGTPMISESEPELHLEGSNVAFTDGHVKWFRDGVVR